MISAMIDGVMRIPLGRIQFRHCVGKKIEKTLNIN